MDFYESDLEDIIYASLKTSDGFETLKKLGLDIEEKPTKVFRQLRIGNYGIADIVTINKWYYNGCPRIFIRVYELKKDDIDEKALIQVHRYVVGIKHYLKLRGYTDVIIESCLIGKKVSNSNWVYIMDEGGLSSVFTYEYKIDGMIFKRETFGYRLIEPNFK